ncbi:MAG: PerC family transcriptional regulator [Yokenella regensburgei]|jgi:hypothetical protein|nr:PerC family transcriptional regulator [Yokenella regensburgei]
MSGGAMVVNDAVAQRLEDSGLWRRAAARWLTVMQSPGLTEAQRSWVRERRAYCQSQIAPVIAPEKLDITEIARAANATQAQMGIARPNGTMFRRYPQEKKARKS